MRGVRILAIGLLVVLAPPVPGQTKNRSRTTAPKASTTQAQPYGLKGDLLGETIEEFRARNDRSIALGLMGKDRASIPPGFFTTKHVPQCTNDPPESDLSPDVQSSFETEEEKRAGVVKCVASLSIDDDMDYDDRPTIAGVQAYRTVYYFFEERSAGPFVQANAPKRLYMIKSTLPSRNYREIRGAFVEKYGAPVIKVAQYQNEFEAKIEGEELLWTAETCQIRVTIYLPKSSGWR